MSPSDLQVARLAARQHHCFARCQALAIGLSYRQIRHRVDVGRWTQLHDSVFCLAGAPIAALGHIHAAVLALPGSAASHGSALHLWGERDPAPRVAHVIRRHGRSHRLHGVHLHQTRLLPRHHVTVAQGIPVTTRARTVFDLAASTDLETLGRLIDRQVVAGSLRLDELELMLDEMVCPGRPGVGQFVAVLDQRVGHGPGVSMLEQRYRALCERRSLPLGDPEAHAPWATSGGPRSERVDFAHPRERVIVELDGRTYHARLDDFENDRRRDQLALAAGWRTVRFTWRQVTADPDHVERILRSVLEVGP